MQTFAKTNFRSPTPSQPASSNDSAKFLDQITAAIHHVWTQWAQMASLGDIVINAAVGTGGKVDGPAWGPLLKVYMPPTGSFSAHWKSVANALNQQWGLYQSSITVPGLPLWPTFSMV